MDASYLNVVMRYRNLDFLDAYICSFLGSFAMELHLWLAILVSHNLNLP